MKRKKKKRSNSKPKLWGFDFGIKRRAMCLQSKSFNDNLIKANVFACGYGSIFSKDLAVHIPVISLVAEKEKYLRKAFEELNSWCENQDGDGVDVTIIFLENKGYIMCISPEVKRFHQRLGFNIQILKPITLQVTWLKPFESYHANLKAISEYSKSLISPIMFQGIGNSSSGEGSNIDPRSGILIDGFLKFNTRFLEEKELNEDDPEFHFINLCKKDDSYNNDLPDPPTEISPKNCFNLRNKTLQDNFFVSLNRLKRSPDFNVHVSTLSKMGIEDWQINQAACNLILSNEFFKGNLHYRGAKITKQNNEIIDLLIAYVERANSTYDYSFIDENSLRTQITLDLIELLEYFEIYPSDKSLNNLLVEMKKNSLHKI